MELTGALLVGLILGLILKSRPASSLSLYSDYIKEREQREILTTDAGFITYLADKEKGIGVLIDIYVKPNHRGQGNGAKLLNAAMDVIRLQHIEKILAVVDPQDKNLARLRSLLESVGLKPILTPLNISMGMHYKELN